VKTAEEIMNILEAYDLTGSLRDAAELAGCSHHTVARYVAERERGRAVPGGPARRPGVITVSQVRDGVLIPGLHALEQRFGPSGPPSPAMDATPGTAGAR
jgi:hypothetical protein